MVRYWHWFLATKRTKVKMEGEQWLENRSRRVYPSSDFKLWIWWWQEDGEVEK
jgi:hypothetical protein